MADIKLGQTVQDRVTKFRGVVTGLVDYLSGCRQALLTPPVGADGKVPDSHWFDVQRLLPDPSAEVIKLNNSKTPGFDRAPPVR